MNSSVDKCVKRYQQKYQELMPLLKNSHIPLENRKSLFDEYTTNCLPLPEMWIERLKMQPKYPISEVINYVKTIKKALFDFYSEEIYDFLDKDDPLPIHWHGFKKIPFDRLMNGRNFEKFQRQCEVLSGKKECQQLVIKNLTFPHSRLDDVLDCYEELTGSHITKEINQLYVKTKTLYAKIIANQQNIKEWFNCLLESEDERFIIQNVECRISEEPLNIELWKLYIKHLKTRNKKAAFEVYSRYHRLFLDDKSFIDDFKIWKGKHPSQRENRYLDKMKYYLPVRNGKQLMHPLTAAPMYFQCDSLPRQGFNIPVSVVNGIIRNANPIILQKLYQSSKYFYYKTQKPLCHTLHLKLYYPSHYYGYSLSLNEKWCPRFENLKKIIIHYQLIVKFEFPSLDIHRRLLSSIIDKLNIESISILKIYSQNFSSDDYKFLTKSNSITKIVLYNVSIYDNADGKYIALEDLFKNLSNAVHIELPLRAEYTNKTWEELSKFVSHKKIKYMYFPGCENIDSKAFVKFICTNCDEGSKVYYPYSNGFQEVKNLLTDNALNIDKRPNINFMIFTEYDREKVYGAY